jgi:NAD(P)-dependent dehydrogenase (short-subunit alcohol dehydrogenase family)
LNTAMTGVQKSILITGCSTGIGHDAARTLARRGWRVFATCRKETDCERLRGEGLESFRLDYEDEASIKAAVTEVLSRTGGTLDALFNNGAYAIPGAVEDLPRNALRAIFEANLFGWADLTNRLMPTFRAQGYGRIIQCSSVLGFIPMKWRGAYVATKYALEGLSDSLRLELRGSNIHVVLIEPGPISTDFRKNAKQQFARWINWENSALSELYRNKLLQRLNTSTTEKDAFELPASAVSKKLILALESPNPAPRYFVTTPTYIANLIRRLLPTRLSDMILAKG